MQGYARNIMEDYKGTLTNYKQTLTINPEFHSLYIMIGVAEVHQKNLSEACRWFNQAVTLKVEGAGKFVKKYCK